VRKITPVDGIQGLMVETVVWLPLALGCVLYWTATGDGMFLTRDRKFDGLLLVSGVLTAVPLLCFGQAARRLSMTTLGFLQYLAPTLQFVIAYYLLDEKKEFGPQNWTGFAFIWTALVIFSLDSLLAAQRRRAVTTACHEPST
jgi:chloramphenicol-sensitive protein RarD